jgi:hypothetical protein
MPKLPTSETIAAVLAVPECVLLFCLAWRNAGISPYSTTSSARASSVIGRVMPSDLEVDDQL